MLPATQRIRRREEFSTTVRKGHRATSPLVVVHVLPGSSEATETARAGFVVSRAVGGAVVRNQVKRRLRHLVTQMLADLPPGSLVVVRALPAAGGASSEQLASSLTLAVARALGHSTVALGGTS